MHTPTSPEKQHPIIRRYHMIVGSTPAQAPDPQPEPTAKPKAPVATPRVIDTKSPVYELLKQAAARLQEIGMTSASKPKTQEAA